MTPSSLEDVARLYDQRGGAWYGGEAVTQRAHATQCAALAEAHGGDAALIAAALLHDVAHLLLAADGADDEVDARHEAIGADLLARWLPPAVTEPVRLHVAAKRWLCATEPAYRLGLSAASRRSLALQGGAFPQAEANAFIAQPWAADAVLLRRWDDAAKDPGGEDGRAFARYWAIASACARGSRAGARG